MREKVNPAKTVTLFILTAYVFISELYWLIQILPELLLGPNGLNLWTPFIFRGLLFITLVWSLIGRLAERYELYAHKGMIADDIKFHLPRQALVFILTIFMIIRILDALL